MKRGRFGELTAIRDAVKASYKKALDIRERLAADTRKADKLLDTKMWGEELHTKFRSEKLADARKALEDVKVVIARGHAALRHGDRDTGRRAFFRSVRFTEEPEEAFDDTARLLAETRELREEQTRARVANELRDLPPGELAAVADDAALRQDAALIAACRREHDRRWTRNDYASDAFQAKVGAAVTLAEMSVDLPDDWKKAQAAVDEIGRELQHLESVTASIQTGDDRAAHEREMIQLVDEHGAEEAVMKHREREAERDREATEAAKTEATKALEAIFTEDAPTETPPLAS